MITLLFPLTLLGLCYVYSGAFLYFHEVWTDVGTYSHGYISLMIALFLYHVNKWQGFSLNSSINQKALGLLFATLLLATIFQIFKIELLYRSSFLLSAALLVKTFIKEQEWKYHYPQFGLLSFALPIWGLSIDTLQYVAAGVVSYGVNLSGVEVMLDGILISIPAGTFKVANGCSGLRYILVAMSLVVVFSHRFLNDKTNMVKLAVIAVVLSILVNWIRIGYLVYVGHVSNMQDPLIADHNMLGWWIFIAPVVLIYVYGYFLEAKERKSPSY